MRALVYHGSGVNVWEDAADPKLRAIVEVGTTTICGTGLHNLNGDLPTTVDGRIIGHEAVGTVSQVGSGVENPKGGDRVLVSFVSACGACRLCRESRYGQCTGGGRWALANSIDGTQGRASAGALCRYLDLPVGGYVRRRRARGYQPASRGDNRGRRPRYGGVVTRCARSCLGQASGTKKCDWLSEKGSSS